MKEKIKVGYIGLGRRGESVLKNNLAIMNDVEVKTVCDLRDDCLLSAKNMLLDFTGKEPITTHDYHDILSDPEIDAVFLMVGWTGRTSMAVEAMRAGKYTAIEVGCADTLDECFALVDAYEETGTPVMMLENCCYGRREMVAYNLVSEGALGEIVHCTGAYMHNLTESELFRDIDTSGKAHYRLPLYISRNCDNYPTHALGPICKVLGINRGNRIKRLVSVASKSAGISSYARRHLGENSEYANIDYKQGDIVNTILTCEGGETIRLTLDTTLPRSYYSRDFGVRGTLGFLDEARRVVWFEHMGGHTCIADSVENNEEEMFAKHEHPLYRRYLAEHTEEDKSHWAMDWLVIRAFVESVKQGINTPIDAYDTALWLSIGPLTEQSIREGGAPVEVPDFTRGRWQSREPAPKSEYSLDTVCK